MARNEVFKNFVHNVALHIAASAPLYVGREEVPKDLIERETEIYRKQAVNEGKPEQVVEKISQGRLNKFFAEICLLEQPYVKDNDITIEELLKENIVKIGENIIIRRFTRYVLGEEI